MSFLKRTDEDYGGGSVDVAPVATTSAGPSSLSAFIDQGSEFEGKLTFRDTVRIDGKFRGEITSENTLVIGDTGEIEATVRSNNVVVSGTVVGNIFAAQKLTLHKSAKVEGDIEASSIVMEEGAHMNGRISMKAGGPGFKAKASEKQSDSKGGDAGK